MALIGILIEPIMPYAWSHEAADWLLVAPHLMVLSLRRTVFFLFACPGMMKVLAMYLAIGSTGQREQKQQETRA